MVWTPTQRIVPNDDVIDDESEDDDTPPQVSYDITSYGADFDVFGLVRRLDNGSILVPEWQRGFVWTMRVASSFIESLLLGLPVPGVFLGVDPGSKALYVIDGQQRLKTLQYFCKGKFPASGKEQDFKLRQVSSRFEGTTYDALSDEMKRAFDDSLIHATLVRQDAPPDDDTSMCEVFRRLNTGGRIVNPQEIRGAVYRGGFIDRLRELNQESAWREVVGKPSPRRKDEEMILRFFAMWHRGASYQKPMSEFLDVFASRNRDPQKEWLDDTSELFRRTIDAFAEAKGKEAFRLGGSGAANAATLDSMMIGLAGRTLDAEMLSPKAIGEIHDKLISDEAFLELVARRTSDETAVSGRLSLASAAFRNAQ